MRKIYLLFLLFSVLAISQKKEGQARIDSLYSVLTKMKPDSLKVKSMLEIAESYISVNPKKSYGYANGALILSKSLKWKDGISKSYYTLGSIYSNDSQFMKSIEYNNLSLKYTIKPQQILNSFQSNSINYYKMNQYEKAIEILNNCIKLSKENNLKRVEINSYLTLGNIYSQLKSNQKAIEYYEISNKIAVTIKDGYTIYLTYLNIGYAYTKSKKHDLAIKSYKKAVLLCEENKNYLDLSDTYGHMGSCYIAAKKYPQAIESFKKALEIDVKENDYFNAPICYSGLGEANFGLKNYDAARKNLNIAIESNIKSQNFEYLEEDYALLGKINLEQGIENSKNSTILFLEAEKNFYNAIDNNKKTNDLEKTSENYFLLAKTQDLLNKNKQAFLSLKESAVYKDSIYNTNNKETIKNLEDKREIELRDKEIKINKLSLESKEKQKWFYILGLGFLGILGGLLFYQSRKRKITNQKLQILNSELDQANKTKTRFFSILNHDLRSPVANLIHFLHLQQDNPELLDEATKTRMQTKTITGAENLLSSMEDILLWSKGQMENFKPQPKNIAVNQLFDDTKKVFSGYLKIKFEYHNPDNIEIFTDENYLKTIIRNLTSNAINVFTTTQNPTIVWKAWQENGNSYLSITDNGSGASRDNFKALYDDTEVVGIKTGLGLHLIRDLAKAINCEISVDSKVGIGTTFVLKLK
jgi:signal transduction histidine kinase/Tfp pilus assembly protein PilF